MSISGLSSTEETMFSTVEKKDLTRPYAQDSRLEFTYTMGLNANKVSRSVYTFWNVLGDIGGLYGVLALACANLISILTYHKSKNYLASQLYSARCPQPSSPLVSQTETQLNLTR